jgi:hypothetical protein
MESTRPYLEFLDRLAFLAGARTGSATVLDYTAAALGVDPLRHP